MPPYSRPRRYRSPRLDWPTADVIGDVHGCAYTLFGLLEHLGYALTMSENGQAIERAIHPEGRHIAFVGDFTDRGRYPGQTLASVRHLTSLAGGGHAAVLGNHDLAAERYLRLGGVKMSDPLPIDHATRQALGWLGSTDAPSSEASAALAWYRALPTHLRIAPAPRKHLGLIVCHAGIDREEVPWSMDERERESMSWGTLLHHERQTVRNRSRQDQPAVTHERPVNDSDRPPWPGWMDQWATRTTGPWCVSGHTPVHIPVVIGRLVLIDTAAAYGNALSAFRWPEATTASVPTDPDDVGRPPR